MEMRGICYDDDVDVVRDGKYAGRLLCMSSCKICRGALDVNRIILTAHCVTLGRVKRIKVQVCDVPKIS